MQFSFCDLKDKLETRYKYALLSTFIIGLFSQGMGLFNKFSVHDDPMNYFIGATYSSGRWMLDILGIVERFFYGDGHYSLPAFNGFLAILFIAISSCLVIFLLDIKNIFSCIFISGLMVCFPVITCLFGFVFTLHLYMISLTFAVLGATLLCKGEEWYFWVFGIIFVGCSVGIYQAYYPVAATLVLFFLVGYIMKSDSGIKSLKKMIISGGGCMLGMAFYFLMNNLYIKLRHSGLDTYKGINEMGKSPISEYISRALGAYRDFFFPNKDDSFCMYPNNILIIYYLALIVSLAFCVYTFIRLIRKSILQAILFTCILLLIPLGVNFIYVMAGNDGETIHSLMVYAQLLPFVFFVWTIENMQIKKKSLSKITSWVAIVVTASLLLMYIRVDNKCYLQVTYAQQEAISYFTTLVTQIKETEGYKDEYPVVFMNYRNNSDQSLKFGDNGYLSDITYYPYYLNVNGYVTDYSWIEFMEQWTGYAPKLLEWERFADNEEVEQMPSYPNYGSIRIIDDIVVVKF